MNLEPANPYKKNQLTYLPVVMSRMLCKDHMSTKMVFGDYSCEFAGG